MTGTNPANFREVDWALSVYREDAAIVNDAFETISHTFGRIDFQFRLDRRRLTSGGTRELWTKASLVPLSNEDGSIKAYMGTIIDISSFKWAEAEQKLRVEEAMRAKMEQENVGAIPVTEYQIFTLTLA